MWWSSKPDPPITLSTKDNINNDDDYNDNDRWNLKELVGNERYTTLISDLETLRDSPYTIALATFALGCISAAKLHRIYGRYFKRIPNAAWVTPDIVRENRWLKGVVVRVGDGDGFHLYHTPSIGWSWPLKFRHIPTKIPSGETISIRIAGVDAPEKGHFGKPTQPHAEETMAWLNKQILGRVVYCQVGLRDQHSRIVALPMMYPRYLPRFLARGKCVSFELLRAGYAEVYRSKVGAYYGRYHLDEFLRLEAQAKAARKGMWIDGSNVETPSEYKRRYRQDAADSGSVVEEAVKVRAPRKGLRRILSTWKS